MRQQPSFNRTDTLFRHTTLCRSPQERKGSEGPIEGWRVEAVAEAGEDDRSTPFVGRRAELSQCRAMLDDVLATKLGHVILLRGAAGIGKSRLAGEVLSAARQAGFTLHRSRVLD